MARQGLDTYHGGRINADEDDRPKRLRYPCFAGGCPMPGTIFTGNGSSAGTCAWHYGVVPNDIPRVTQVLNDWACLAYEVNEARRVMSGELAADPKAIADAFRTAWERVQPLAGTWADELAPSTIKHRNRFNGQVTDTNSPESYADWAKRLHTFLGARVVEVLSINQRRRAA